MPGFSIRKHSLFSLNAYLKNTDEIPDNKVKISQALEDFVHALGLAASPAKTLIEPQLNGPRQNDIKPMQQRKDIIKSKPNKGQPHQEENAEVLLRRLSKVDCL